MLQDPLLSTEFEFADVIGDMVDMLDFPNRRLLQLIGTDRAGIYYYMFEPPTPAIATIVFLEDAIATVLAQGLAQDHRIRVLSFLGRHNGPMQEGGQLLRDIRSMVQFVRCNYPSAPVILGGFGVGATLATNYSLWKDREPVQALVRPCRLVPVADCSLLL